MSTERPPQVCQLYVGGSRTSFRCTCKANVFTTVDHVTYKCNACGNHYSGEPA